MDNDTFAVVVMNDDGEWRNIPFGNEGATIGGVMELLKNRGNISIEIRRLQEDDEEDDEAR